MEPLNIVLSAARILYAPVGTNLPADSLAADGVWPAGWVEFGYTSAPCKFVYSFEALDAKAQQALGVIKRRRHKETFEADTVLAELDLAQLAVGWDAINANTPAGIGQHGKQVMDFGDEPILTERAFGFEGVYDDADGVHQPVRVFMHRATVASGGEFSFDSDSWVGFPVKFSAMSDTTKARGRRLGQIQKITAEPTA